MLFMSVGLLVLAVISTNGQVQAASAADCSVLMKYGIYDKFSTFTSESQFSQVKHFFSDYNFGSKAEASQKAANLGLDISGVLGLTIGGTTSDSNFAQWSQGLQQSDYSTVSNQFTGASNVQTISSAITSLVSQCINSAGFHAYVTPSIDQQTFTFTIGFTPLTNNQPTVNAAFTMTPASVASSCSPQGIIGAAPRPVGIGGLSISCKRLPTDTVAIVVNGDISTSLTYDRFVTPALSATFTASPTTINAGASSTLSWDVQNASQVILVGPGISNNPVLSPGTLGVQPGSTTQYELRMKDLNGAPFSRLVSVQVNQPPPPPPSLSHVEWLFHTNDDNKDHDTRLTTQIICAGATMSTRSEDYGEFKDNSDFGMDQPNNAADKNSIHGCLGLIRIDPNGHDTWKFNYRLRLTWSDGSRNDYTDSGKVLSQDTRSLTFSIP